MKYIMMQYESKGTHGFLPFTFSRLLNHVDVADTLERCKVYPNPDDFHHWVRADVVSAGFVSEEGICGGRSESLDLDHHMDDTMILARHRQGGRVVITSDFTKREPT